ncbi:MAG: S-formylglutathione hydrolase [Gammaproteobacteria bacterium]|jgi:S-formylglutathione hydrolase|nr:S-formylglutathione hydrolase [Gammaproteobacteria bacterium]
MNSTTPELISRSRLFGGYTHTFRHHSDACGCPMQFALYLPPQAESGPVPAVYWLSGLTCTEENFTIKSGAQRYAAELGIALVAPDTSPRGLGLPGEDDDWDLGTGAGFYVNATEAPWAGHYNMYDYVACELPALVESTFPVVPGRRSVSGHSMGGHGALIVALKNPGMFRSVSAFAPICAPMDCPWGQKAFSHYLGRDRSAWEAWDATRLVRRGGNDIPLMVDQGDADEWLEQQLQPELLRQACEEAGHTLTLRMQPGYDHGYFFVSTFIGEHLEYHAKALAGD